MSLAACKECGRQVSTQAKACPGCGGPPPKLPSPKISWKGWAALALAGWVLITVFSRNSNESTDAAKVATASDGNQGSGLTDENRQSIWIEKGKDAVKQRLKDPESVQFRKTYFHRGKSGVPVACGQVNAKNSMGGYTGFQRFVSGASVELTYLEKEVDGFAKVWNELCSN